MPGKQTWNREKHQSASYNPKLSKDNPWVLYVQGWQNYRAITKLIVFLALGGSWAILIIVQILQLLTVCSQHVKDVNMKFNVKKSNNKAVRSREDRNEFFLYFTCVTLLLWHTHGHPNQILTDDLSSDKDIYWQCCKLYAQANMLLLQVPRWNNCQSQLFVLLFLHGRHF